MNRQQHSARSPSGVQHVSQCPTAGDVRKPRPGYYWPQVISWTGRSCHRLPPLFHNFHSTLTFRLHNANTVGSVVAVAISEIPSCYIPPYIARANQSTITIHIPQFYLCYWTSTPTNPTLSTSPTTTAVQPRSTAVYTVLDE